MESDRQSISIKYSVLPLKDLMSSDWLKSVLFELSNISHVINIRQETAQHLLCHLMFVVNDKMTQIQYLFYRKVQASFFTLNLD